MSLLGKIFVALLLAVGVYIFWPRQASLQTFVPEQLAAQEIAAWQAIQSGSTFGATLKFFQLYTTQFGMNPVQALNLGTTQAAAIAGILRTKDAETQDAYEPDFIEAATIFCREVRGKQEGPALGRADFHVWGALADQEDQKKLVPLVQSQLMHWSGLSAASLQSAAEMRARALHAVFAGKARAVEWNLIQVQLAGAWSIIKDQLPSPAANP